MTYDGVNVNNKDAIIIALNNLKDKKLIFY